MVSTAPELVLSNGKKIPLIGLGCFFGHGPPETHNPTSFTRYIENAIDIGYRYFDTNWTNKTESCIGNAVRNKIKTGVIRRDDVIVATKLAWTHHALEDVEECFTESFDALGLDYIDLYYISWPCAIKKPKDLKTRKDLHGSEGVELYQESDYIQIWKKLEGYVKQGKIKSLGLSNFNARQVQDILDNCTVKPVVNQCEIHLYYQNLRLTELCRQKDIVMIAYTPLGQSHQPCETKGWVYPLQDPVLADIAQKYGKTPAQIALRFITQQNIVVIPNSSNTERQKENFNIFDFDLHPDDFGRLSALDKVQKIFLMEWMKDHKDYPFHDPY